MANLAGQKIVAGKVSGERIATTVRITDSVGVTTTETVVDSVVAPVVAGRVYRVRYVMRVNSTVAGDDPLINVRENTVSGTILTQVALDIPTVSRTPMTVLEAEFTATLTTSKTFVGTIDRVVGTGTLTAEAGASLPTYLYVDFIR